MATIELSRQHTLGVDAARQAVEAVARRLQGELNARYHWSENRLNFNCPGAEGTIAVEGQVVSVAIDLSWMLKPMRGRIEASINDYLDEYLS